MRTAILLLLLAGCSAPRIGPYSTPSGASRETSVAEKLNREAADLIESDPGKSESILREALTKDLFYGPAHNNLGVVFLSQDKLYEAANEFEWARKLMPGQPDPHVNLAITMERAARNEDAYKSYEAALEARAEYMPAIQGIASLAVRTRRTDPRLKQWLDRVAMESDDPIWRQWAQLRSLESE